MPPSPLSPRWIAAVVLLGVGATTAGAAAGFAAAHSDRSRPPRAPAAVTTTTTVPATSPVPATPPTTVPAVTLRPGDAGAEVAALQRRLGALGYWVGEADGVYGATTEQAVLAFQKAEGQPRDGIAGPATRARLAGASRPEPRSPAGTGAVVEIDLTRQLLLVVRDGETVVALNTSTGTARTPTPPGRYAVERQIDGIRRAPLGSLYRPKYFHEGYAVHGSPEIPGWPASHGCARLADAAMDMLWSEDLLPVGTPVWVYA